MYKLFLRIEKCLEGFKVWVKYNTLRRKNRIRYSTKNKKVARLPGDFTRKYKANCKKHKIKYDLNRVKLYIAFNNTHDLNYITEEFYKYYIEPYLNLKRYSSTIFQNKAFIDLLPKVFNDIPDVFIFNYLKKINGVFYDTDLINQKSPETIISNIKDEKIIYKKILDTGSSKGVQMFFKNKNGDFINNQGTNLKDYIYHENNFILQKVIRQHSILSKFNETSLNTARIITYRSVKDEKIHILHQYIRIGDKGELFDTTKNASRIRILKNGTLHSKRLFRDLSLQENEINVDFPEYEEVIQIAKNIASHFVYHRIIGFDFAVDSSSDVKIIEFNTGLTPEPTNILTGSFFGEFTDEVMDYVNKKRMEGKICG
ncbi:MAG: hypothetical protein EA412_05340 [Chitinophagaceae bacterium]|nr:MAG: hypothetical protein EA412_05340 [Chitinophagaceae bacterium]